MGIYTEKISGDFAIEQKNGSRHVFRGSIPGGIQAYMFYASDFARGVMHGKKRSDKEATK